MEKKFNDSIKVMQDLLLKDGAKKRVPSKRALDSGEVLWSLECEGTDSFTIYPFTWNTHEVMVLLGYSESWSEATKEVLSVAACDILSGLYFAMKPIKISLVDVDGGVIRIDFRLSDNLKAKGVKDYYILNRNINDPTIVVTIYKEDESEQMYLVGYDNDGDPFKEKARLEGQTITIE